MPRALQSLECYLPKPLAEAFLIDCLRAAIRRRCTSCSRQIVQYYLLSPRILMLSLR
jgi:hypothetical protein